VGENINRDEFIEFRPCAFVYSFLNPQHVICAMFFNGYCTLAIIKSLSRDTPEI
jgi:hypothetical protein